MRDVEPWFGATSATSDTRSQIAQFQSLKDPWVCHRWTPCQWEGPTAIVPARSAHDPRTATSARPRRPPITCAYAPGDP
eukprot:COSAG05_NODE_119_length_17779_cov_273.146049_5_plen_79_part_00